MLNFHLSVTDRQLPQLRHALASQDIAFDPERDLIPAMPEPLHDGIFTGPYGDLAAGELRKAFLNRPGSPVLKTYDRLSIQEKADLLSLASLHCCWTQNLEPEITDLSERELDDYLDEHPDAFQTTPAHPRETTHAVAFGNYLVLFDLAQKDEIDALLPPIHQRPPGDVPAYATTRPMGSKNTPLIGAIVETDCDVSFTCAVCAKAGCAACGPQYLVLGYAYPVFTCCDGCLGFSIWEFLAQGCPTDCLPDLLKQALDAEAELAPAAG